MYFICVAFMAVILACSPVQKTLIEVRPLIICINIYIKHCKQCIVYIKFKPKDLMFTVVIICTYFIKKDQ